LIDGKTHVVDSRQRTETLGQALDIQHLAHIRIPFPNVLPRAVSTDGNSRS
jgi:hypothetical protein